VIRAKFIPAKIRGETIFKLSGYRSWNDNELANNTGINYQMQKCANAEQYKISARLHTWKLKSTLSSSSAAREFCIAVNDSFVAAALRKREIAAHPTSVEMFK
jgi:hypothetical protein